MVELPVTDVIPTTLNFSPPIAIAGSTGPSSRRIDWLAAFAGHDTISVMKA